MGGNLSPVVRAFRERNQPPRQEAPARSPAPVAPAAVARPGPGGTASSIMTPLIAAAAASRERLTRAFRERKQRSREEPAQSPEPSASPSLPHAEPRDAAPSMVTPLMVAAAASTEWLTRSLRDWKQRSRRKNPARSLKSAAAEPLENREPGGTAPSMVTRLIEAAAASTERLVRAFRERQQRFRGKGRARSPELASSGPVENPGPGGTAPSMVTPLMAAAAASTEPLVRAYREQKQRFRWEGRARSEQPVAAEPIENPEPGGAAPSIATPLIEAAAASTEWPVRALSEPSQPSRQENTVRLIEVAAPPVAIAEPTNRALATAAPVAVEAAPPPTAWPKFPGDIGYADRLRANAALLAKLILMASTVGVTAAEIWQDRWPDAPVKRGPDELKTIKSEAALVCIQFIDEMADKYLLPLDKNSLMTELQALVASGLESVHAIDAAAFQPLLQARSQEYRQCQELRGKGEAAGDQAFLRQGAKRIAATIGIGDSPFFNDTVTNLLMKQFARWGVPDLLRR